MLSGPTDLPMRYRGDTLRANHGDRRALEPAGSYRPSRRHTSDRSEELVRDSRCHARSRSHIAPPILASPMSLAEALNRLVSCAIVRGHATSSDTIPSKRSPQANSRRSCPAGPRLVLFRTMTRLRRICEASGRGPECRELPIRSERRAKTEQFCYWAPSEALLSIRILRGGRVRGFPALHCLECIASTTWQRGRDGERPPAGNPGLRQKPEESRAANARPIRRESIRGCSLISGCET